MSENKTIARAKKIIRTRLDKIDLEYKDAEQCWNDSGYARYRNKMEKLEEERDEISAWVDRTALVAQMSENSCLRRELADLMDVVRHVRKKVREMTEKEPDDLDLQALERLLGDIR